MFTNTSPLSFPEERREDGKRYRPATRCRPLQSVAWLQWSSRPCHPTYSCRNQGKFTRHINWSYSNDVSLLHYVNFCRTNTDVVHTCQRPERFPEAASWKRHLHQLFHPHQLTLWNTLNTWQDSWTEMGTLQMSWNLPTEGIWYRIGSRGRFLGKVTTESLRYLSTML